MKNKISILEIKKYLKKIELEVNKKKLNKNTDSNLPVLSRTFLASLIIVSIFLLSKCLNSFILNFSKDFENNSKNNLKKLLDNKNIIIVT